jgi:hypothetical protein
MKKVLFAIGGALLALLVIFVVIDEIAGHMVRERLHDRRAHWTVIVEKEVPVGATREEVGQWAKRTFSQACGDGSPTVYPGSETASFAAETIPEPGFKFPCAAWSIIIQIDFDATGHVTGRRVDEAGICV